MLKIFIHIIFGLILYLPSAYSQVHVDTLPSVFLIGEHEISYNKMLRNQPDLLMSVCDDDMDKAYSTWLNFLVEVERFAIENDVDIKGVKLWINVFWNPDGSIKHIAFYPKPNSKNMDYDYVSALFKEFAKTQNSGLVHNKMVCHYGSASFPSFITSGGNEDK